MIGSVFSPYYAWSGRNDPQNHVALNVGLYGRGGKRWTMTERSRNNLVQEKHRLVIGPSDLAWDGNCLTISIDEWANPILRKVVGQIKLFPNGISERVFQLDDKAQHFWQPLSPIAHAEVSFHRPSLNWKGKAYIDSNWGFEPLEKGFKNWDWSRGHTKSGAILLYDAFTRDETNRQLALKADDHNNITDIEIEPRQKLKNAPIWRVARTTLADPKTRPTTKKMLEDTPFYTRSYIDTAHDKERILAVHESLDCDRFASSWVRCLLPFRMPRVTK